MHTFKFVVEKEEAGKPHRNVIRVNANTAPTSAYVVDRVVELTGAEEGTIWLQGGVGGTMLLTKDVEFDNLPRVGRLIIEKDDSPASLGVSLLALPWRRTSKELEIGSFTVGGKKLPIHDVANSDEGTGLITWDGATALARHLETHARKSIKNRNVLELGAGTGLSGLAAAALGASHVLLTDLPYSLSNLERNVARCEAEWGLERGKCISVAALDWCQPIPASISSPDAFDVVLISDCVWLDYLVEPLVSTLSSLSTACPTMDIFMSYQLRARSTRKLLMDCLFKAGFSILETRIAFDSMEIFRMRKNPACASCIQ
jgi:hypothetical protein